MGLREDLQKKIDRKQEEIQELKLQIREAEAYLQGMIDTLKMLPRESAPKAEDAYLRPDSDLAQAREAIRKTKRPLHISELLKALGKQATVTARAGLSGNIAAYVRRGEIFTRPAPNTFGLVELDQQATPAAALPEDFGNTEKEKKAPVTHDASDDVVVTDDDVPF